MAYDYSATDPLLSHSGNTPEKPVCGPAPGHGGYGSVGGDFPYHLTAQTTTAGPYHGIHPPQTAGSAASSIAHDQHQGGEQHQWGTGWNPNGPGPDYYSYPADSRPRPGPIPPQSLHAENSSALPPVPPAHPPSQIQHPRPTGYPVNQHQPQQFVQRQQPAHPQPFVQAQPPVYNPTVHHHVAMLVTEESYTHTKYECNGEFYRNQLVISAVFLVCGVLCLNMFFIPCAVAACINAIKTAEANKNNRPQEAKGFHKKARWCNIIGLILCIVAVIGSFVIVITVLRETHIYPKIA